MKNRYRNSNYDQQWNNENDNYRGNKNQFENERYRQNNPNYDSWQNMDNDFDRPGYNYSQSNAGNYQDLGNENYQNRGERNWYGRQYENQYSSNRPDEYRRNEYNAYSNETNHRNNDSYNNQERGWWDKTTDEVSSWFGDDEAKRRRRMDEIRENNHRGKGPKNYTRSSERIKEDVNDHLGDHWMLDASNIEVEVNGTEVTLSGTVNSKENKRRAEDIADSVSGVTHVQNNLRVTRISENDSTMDTDNNSNVNTSNNYKTRKETLNHN
ncbi:MAG: BON domain-containing protein [Ginsengibacter sp.]